MSPLEIGFAIIGIVIILGGAVVGYVLKGIHARHRELHERDQELSRWIEKVQKAGESCRADHFRGGVRFEEITELKNAVQNTNQRVDQLRTELTARLDKVFTEIVKLARGEE